MKARLVITGAAIAALIAFVGQAVVSAENAPADNPHPGMVIEDDVVTEWENPKLTELTRLTDLARASETAKSSPVLVFKHSTTCPISGRAAQRMDTLLTGSEKPLPTFYMVKVIESRPVSNAIADQYEVKHESPQILLLKDGKAVWNTSHDDITAENVLEALERHEAFGDEPTKEEPENND